MDILPSGRFEPERKQVASSLTASEAWQYEAAKAMSRGWCCFPLWLGPGFDAKNKKILLFLDDWPELATTDPAAFEKLCQDFKRQRSHTPNAFGVLTGEKSNLLVVDIDDLDSNWLAEREQKLGKLPPTYTVLTGQRGNRRGSHRYYRHPGGHVKSFKVQKEVDVQADGGRCVIGAGAYHPCGLHYEECPGSPDEPQDLPPEWIDELRKGKTLKGISSQSRHASRRTNPNQTSALVLVGAGAHWSSWTWKVIEALSRFDFSEYSGSLWTNAVPDVSQYLQGFGLADDEAEFAVNTAIDQAVLDGRWPTDRDPEKFKRDILGYFRYCKPIDIERGRFGCFRQTIKRGVVEGLLQIREPDIRSVALLAIVLGHCWTLRIEKGKAALPNDTVSGYMRLADKHSKELPHLYDHDELKGRKQHPYTCEKTATQAFSRTSYALSTLLNPRSNCCILPLLPEKIEGNHPQAAEYTKSCSPEHSEHENWTANVFMVSIPENMNNGEDIQLEDACKMLGLPVPMPWLLKAAGRLQKKQRRAKSQSSEFRICISQKDMILETPNEPKDVSDTAKELVEGNHE